MCAKEGMPFRSTICSVGRLHYSVLNKEGHSEVQFVL
jgi:hypothetical protein